MRKPKIKKGREAHVRDLCAKAIEFDRTRANPVVDGTGLTDRQWLAQSVLNILDGAIDAQIIQEIRRGQR